MPSTAVLRGLPATVQLTNRTWCDPRFGDDDRGHPHRKYWVYAPCPPSPSPSAPSAALYIDTFTMAEQVRGRYACKFVLLICYTDREGIPEATHLSKCQGAWCVISSRGNEDWSLKCDGLGGKKLTKEKRWYKDVGLGYKTPIEAINGTYIGA